MHRCISKPGWSHGRLQLLRVKHCFRGSPPWAMAAIGPFLIIPRAFGCPRQPWFRFRLESLGFLQGLFWRTLGCFLAELEKSGDVLEMINLWPPLEGQVSDQTFRAKFSTFNIQWQNRDSWSIFEPRPRFSKLRLCWSSVTRPRCCERAEHYAFWERSCTWDAEMATMDPRCGDTPWHHGTMV